MDAARIERAALLLADSRKTGRPLSQFPAHSRPASVPEALAVQEAVTRLSGATISAWKVGAPPNAKTTYAPIYDADLFPNGAAVALSRYPGMRVEGEVAFHLGADLPASGRPYCSERVAWAAKSLCAAFEIGFSRMANFDKADTAERVADNLGNGGLVIGSGNAEWRNVDFKSLHVTMTANGKTLVSRRGGKPGDDPFTLLVWAANNLASGLSAGDIVTTGSWTGLYSTRPGDHIVIDFAGVGSVQMTCE